MQGVQQGSVGRPPARAAALPHLKPSEGIKRQSNFRLAAGWLLLVFWTVSVISLDWDADWHTRVGRDGFWTPPHLVFYGTIAAAGIVCLGVVLMETLLYYRRYPGFTNETTTPVLWVFRGPVGFMLAGFGMVVMLSSAPLDDYWHRIFGVDVKVWAPFHVMLLIGIIMASLGIVYLFASEVTRRRNWQTGKNEAATSLPGKIIENLRGLVQPATLGLTLAMLFFVTRYLFLMGPDTASRGTLTIGELRLPSYSLIMMFVPVVLVALVVATGRIGIATFAGLIFLLFRQVDAPIIQWGIDYLVTDQGRTLRSGGLNQVTWTSIYPIFMPLVGLLIDGIYLLTQRWRQAGKTSREMLVAVGAAMAAGLALFLLDKPWEFTNQLIRSLIEKSGTPNASAVADAQMFRPDYWAAVPLALVLAALAGLVGWAFGTSLRYTDL